MGVEEYSTVSDDNTISLVNNEVVLKDFKVLKITEDISEITLTSKGKICKGTILVKPRKTDLIINIENLRMQSEEHIAIDFRGGKNNSYKSYIYFKGNNLLESKGNIGICISNNQTVEICGEENSFLI